MSNVLVNRTSLENIADAIRTVNGSDDTYLPSEMAGEIEKLYVLDGASCLMGDITKIEDPREEITYVKQYAQYSNSSLTSIDLPVATQISSYAFMDCTHLTSINLPSAVEIQSYAFYWTGLTSVNLPLVQTIGARVFEECSDLVTVILPSVRSIGEKAFQDCRHLEALILPDTEHVCTAGSNLLYYANNAYVYVPEELVDTYKAANNWSTYSSRIRAIDDYDEIMALLGWEVEEGDE